MKGSGRSFPSIEELLSYYETNPVSSEYGEIGVSYSSINTRQWHLEYKDRMKNHKEVETKEINVTSNKQKCDESRNVSQTQLMELQKTLLEEQTETMKKVLMEPLAQQQRDYQEKIVELEKAHQELLESLQSKKRRHKKCSVQ